MTRRRASRVLVPVTTCAVGAVVLHLLGVPVPAAVAIGALACAGTLFTAWAHTLHIRRCTEHPDR